MKRWRERATVISEVTNNTLNVSRVLELSKQKPFREAACGNTLE